MPFVWRVHRVLEPIKAIHFLKNRGISSQKAQKIIDKGRLRQDFQPVKKSQMLCGEIQLCEFEAGGVALEPLFENDDFCVYDKPHNLLTHPKSTQGDKSLNDALKSRYGNGANAIHRLDKETSGLMLCAINPRSERQLKILMQNRAIKKHYIARVEGKLTDCILINAPILAQKRQLPKRELEFNIDSHLLANRAKAVREGEISEERDFINADSINIDSNNVDSPRTQRDLWIKSIISPLGKVAQTKILPISYDESTNTSLIQAIPLTGRTHQIRVHLAHIGHRILGEPLYGAKECHSRKYLESTLSSAEYERYFGAPHLCLNACYLGFCFAGEGYVFFSKFRV